MCYNNIKNLTGTSVVVTEVPKVSTEGGVVTPIHINLFFRHSSLNCGVVTPIPTSTPNKIKDKVFT